jgi:hypothetical protein
MCACPSSQQTCHCLTFDIAYAGLSRPLATRMCRIRPRRRTARSFATWERRWSEGMACPCGALVYCIPSFVRMFSSDVSPPMRYICLLQLDKETAVAYACCYAGEGSL